MSTTKPSIDLPRALPHEDAPNYYALTDLTNLIIADTVWSHRKQARMSETKLANTMNKNRNFVRRVESGQYSITLAEFKSVAEALNLDHFEFAKEVLGEIDMASKAITAIAEPGIFLIEPHAQVDTQGDLKEDVQEDAPEDSKECAQVEAQGDLKEEVQDDTPEDAQECMQDDAEEDARDDARGCVQEDVEEDIEQECVQKSAKKPKRGTYRNTFRNRRKMPPKESKKDTKNDQDNAQENIAGTDPEGPAPVD